MQQKTKDWLYIERRKHHRCICGCKQYIKIKPEHKWKSIGIPKYILGHSSFKNADEYINNWILKNKEKYFCKCGCNNKIIIKYQHYFKGIPDFCPGHNFTGKHHSEETKLKMSGKNNHNFGKHHSKETKNKIGLGNKGKFVSEETKQKQSKALKGKYVGHLASGWKGGICSKRNDFYGSLEYNIWRKLVYERDYWTCQECGVKAKKINAHHIIPWRNCQDTSIELNIMNGITLCESCHRKTYNNEYRFINKYLEIIKKYIIYDETNKISILEFYMFELYKE